MTAKEEIKRRLKKADFMSISKTLYDKSFDDLDSSEYQDMLKIADVYGQKYKKFYKLKDDIDIRTFTSNLTPEEYNPSFSNHTDLNVINTVKSDESFTIYTEFYTSELVDIPVEIDGIQYKKKEAKIFRRTMILEKSSNNDYLVISIDLTGDGADVYKKIDENLSVLQSTLGLDIHSFFDTIEVEKVIYSLIDDNELVPTRLTAKDQSSNIVKSAQAKALRGTLKDDDFYSSCTNEQYSLENLKMKYDKESVEIFGKTLLKITTKMGKNNTDELTTKTISILQRQ